METRLLAILLTDLSGFGEFSSHTGRRGLAVAVHRQQKIIGRIIQELGGLPVKWNGDTALATHGPVTDAILCGPKIQVAFVKDGAAGDPLAAL